MLNSCLVTRLVLRYGFLMKTGLVLRIVGLVAGAAIAAVDNFAFGGEVSPIVIVGMLLILVGTAGIIWGIRAIPVALIIWLWLPEFMS